MGSLFGQMDVNDIPDNPYAVGEGEYEGTIVTAEFRKTKKDDVDKLVLGYEVADEESEFFGNEVQEWLTYHPDLTKAELASMDSKTRSTVNKDLARIKNRLKSLGIPPEEQGSLDIDDLIGMAVEFRVEESEDDDDPEKKYYNVRYVKAL